MTITSHDVEALHELVVEMRDELHAQAEVDGTRGSWEAYIWLDKSLYDIWGAFGYLAIEEREAS